MRIFERVLIETLWNVNYQKRNPQPLCIRVLIETLWNVNFLPEPQSVASDCVLIETLWNVNDETPSVFSDSPQY